MSEPDRLNGFACYLGYPIHLVSGSTLTSRIADLQCSGHYLRYPIEALMNSSAHSDIDSRFLTALPVFNEVKTLDSVLDLVGKFSTNTSGC